MLSTIKLKELEDAYVSVTWEEIEQVEAYHVYWADQNTTTTRFRFMTQTKECYYKLNKGTHKQHYIKIAAVIAGKEVDTSDVFQTPIKKILNEQLEMLNRGLVVVQTKTGIFLSWRLLKQEVSGHSDSGLTGTDFAVYKNGLKITVVKDSTNYLDVCGTKEDRYCVAPISLLGEGPCCLEIKAWESGENFIEIPLKIPADGVTPRGDRYTYEANDMSVGDVDGDGEYEYILKWNPTNAQDVSIKGYTGNCLIDCYKLDGRLLWRLDMGKNIRAGAHYTQFMVYDFDGDGKAEMSVKTAPGTQMTCYNEDGSIREAFYITLPQGDLDASVSHEDNYVCSASDYEEYLIAKFCTWHIHPEVLAGRWPKTLEACFDINQRYPYPLNKTDATALVTYFIDVYAKQRSPKNDLRAFEGFIFEGPEYLTMFGGDGRELETIPFRFPRGDDGLMWGDYAMKRIEPCNRVDRFLSGVAYLDGETPSLIIARGYYTRTTLVAYHFKKGYHEEVFAIDSGHVPMNNPFKDNPHAPCGTDPVYGCLAGQGNHSLATADVDGDGCHEIIYGACVIDHDGSLLYSSEGIMPDGRIAKLGHGDALHVANLDPDKPGLEIFSVFEGGVHAPYGYALRDAETGEVIFGKYAEVDLGRCMVGDIDPKSRGYQVWVNEVFDCRGQRLDIKPLGTNQAIRFAGDLTTQIIDGPHYLEDDHAGIINDHTHGVMLCPQNSGTNNGTKGNPCLIADVFGDFREELLIRRADNKAIRIYISTEITPHKLYTLMHDTQYRTGIAWQNNCYNQPCYPSFYYGKDMDWSLV